MPSNPSQIFEKYIAITRGQLPETATLESAQLFTLLAIPNLLNQLNLSDDFLTNLVTSDQTDLYIKDTLIFNNNGLLFAISNSNISTALKLLQILKKHSPQSRQLTLCQQDSVYQHTPLILAITKGWSHHRITANSPNIPQSIIIKEILNSENNLSIANKTGNTPWHVAYLHRDLNTINELSSCATMNGNFNTLHEQLNSRNHNQEKPKEMASYSYEEANLYLKEYATAYTIYDALHFFIAGQFINHYDEMSFFMQYYARSDGKTYLQKIILTLPAIFQMQKALTPRQISIILADIKILIGQFDETTKHTLQNEISKWLTSTNDLIKNRSQQVDVQIIQESIDKVERQLPDSCKQSLSVSIFKRHEYLSMPLAIVG